MNAITLNLLAVLVAGVINMVVGAIWYAPSVFGKTWMKELGMKKEDGMMDKSKMTQGYIVTFIGALVMAYVAAMIVAWSGAGTIAEGMMVGFWIWLGFAITIPLNDVVFGKKTNTLYMLNIGYYIVVLLINGALLAVWK
jgi:hypothetical protein